MALFKNSTADSPLTSVEFSPVSDGNLTFFTAKNAEAAEAVKALITSAEIGQKIIAQANVNGQPVFITQGDKREEDIRSLLKGKGDALSEYHEKKPINLWAVRGGMSVVGQTLQLTSSAIQVEQIGARNKAGKLINPDLMKHLEKDHLHYNRHINEGDFVRKSFAPDIGVFAILNLIANGANMMFGGQKESADNRLHHVKGLINDQLDEHLAPGETVLPVDKKRAHLRTDPPPPKTMGQKVHDFAEENSVRFFELGLRFAAAVALVIPMKEKSLLKGWEHLRKFEVVKAYEAAKNTVPLTRYSGFGYLGGKTIALFTKVPDPYDDKPHTAIDTFREKYLFKLGSVIEAFAGVGIMVNAYQTKNIGWKDEKRADIKPYRDWMGTVGGALFAAGYVVRLGAKFGERKIDMEEVYAHATDTLAKTPPEKVPQLLAESAAALTEHFKDQKLSYGEVFAAMMNDLYQYHHVAVNPPDAPNATKPVETQEKSAPSFAAAVAKPSTSPDAGFAESTSPKRGVAHVASGPAASHAAAVQNTPAGGLAVS